MISLCSTLMLCVIAEGIDVLITLDIISIISIINNIDFINDKPYDQSSIIPLWSKLSVYYCK